VLLCKAPAATDDDFYMYGRPRTLDKIGRLGAARMLTWISIGDQTNEVVADLVVAILGNLYEQFDPDDFR
jgi:hypothetical protein